MYEHWTFGYENAVFATPAIGLSIVDRAIKELEWVTDRGARIVYIRPAPVFGFGGPRSFALPEFDPFWEAMQEKDVVVGLHNTVNMRYPVDLAELDGTREAGGYFERPTGASAPFRALATPRSQTSDLIASMIGHGMLTRFPAAEGRDRRTLQRVDPPDVATTSPRHMNVRPSCSTRTRSRCCAGTSGSTSSATPTLSSSSGCSASPTACSARTSRIPRACATLCLLRGHRVAAARGSAGCHGRQPCPSHEGRIVPDTLVRQPCM